jgi:hypothetical protein
MTTSRKWCEMFADVPTERVLAETDGPHGKCGERPAEPADISRVITRLGQQWRVEQAEAESLFCKTTNASPIECRARTCEPCNSIVCAARLSRRSDLKQISLHEC